MERFERRTLVSLAAVAVGAILAVMNVSCRDPPVSEELSCEVRHGFVAEYARALDVLLVVDDSAAMADFPDAAGELATGVQALVEWGCHAQDLHIGVITGDPADDGALVGAPPLLRWRDRPDGAGERNFDGPIRDAVEPRAAGDLAGSAEQQPLEMAARALDGRNPGFRRNDAALLVIFVTATDDHSPRSVAHYASLLRDAARDPGQVVVAATDRPEGSAPRLTELIAGFPQRNASGSLSEPDGVLDLFLPVLACLPDASPGPMCLRDIAPDVDECVVSELTWRPDGTSSEALLPACRDAGPDQPCWRIELDEVCDGEGDGTRLFVDRAEYPHQPTSLLLRCEICAQEQEEK